MTKIQSVRKYFIRGGLLRNPPLMEYFPRLLLSSYGITTFSNATSINVTHVCSIESKYHRPVSYWDYKLLCSVGGQWWYQPPVTLVLIMSNTSRDISIPLVLRTCEILMSLEVFGIINTEIKGGGSIVTIITVKSGVLMTWNCTNSKLIINVTDSKLTLRCN